MENGQPSHADTDGATVLVGRRVRALAHLVPVLKLERNKSAGGTGRDWRIYDVKLLTIAAVDKIAIDAGLTGQSGVPRDEVLATLTGEAARCAPERLADEHSQVARWLLDSLLNHNADTISHEVPYVDVTDDYAQRTLSVRLLYETIADDGQTILVNVDPAAVHLLISALDRNLADAQVATDAVLNFQIETGRLDDAVASAQRALILSRQYREQLRSYLRSVEQNIHTVDWDHQVEPALDEALTHVTGRVRYERELLDHARSGRLGDSIPANDSDPATATLRRRASEIHQLMIECLQTHAELQNDLVGARQRFRDEQARQAFAPPAPIGTVDLVEEVLIPLLQHPPGDVNELDETLLHAFVGTAAPKVLSFGPFVDVLVRAPAAPDTAPEPIDVELEELDIDFGRFDERHEAALDSLTVGLKQPTRLSELLARIEIDIDDPTFAYEVSLLVALTVLRLFRPDGPDPSGWSATDDGTRLSTPHIPDAPDLVLHPPADLTTSSEEYDDDALAG